MLCKLVAKHEFAQLYLLPAMECKVVIVGASYVGKTSFTRMFMQDVFQEYYEPTLENTFRKRVTIIDSQSCLVEVTDTSGFDGYEFLLESAIRNGDVFICMYAMDHHASFETMDKYIRRVKLIKPKAPILLVCNKIDLQSESSTVNINMGYSLAQQFQIPILPASAKLGIGVEEAFVHLVLQLQENKSVEKDHKQCCIIC